MTRRPEVTKIVLTYPLTWLAVLLVIALEWGFIAWFRPPLLISAGMLVLGVVLLVIWPIMFLRSQAFRQLYMRLPYELDVKELERLLQSCSKSFRKPAQECLILLDNTRQEFQSQAFQSELDRIFQNLFDLSRNHSQLYARFQQFGTDRQQQTMQHLLEQQVRSVENSLTALKTFSGNLTLLDAHPEDHERMGSDLKAINQELQNVIQEV
jgi:hypothetical protein